MQGPFPTGAVVQDRLIGRIAADDELSTGQDEWRPFAAWPELVAALAATPRPGASSEPGWLSERERARLRWADERGGPDRRASDAAQPLSERRDPERERRSRRNTDNASRGPMPAGRRLATDSSVIKILAALALVAGLIALVIWVYGPVNPVTVRIR